MSGQIRDEVLVKPIVKLVEPGSLPKSEGKAVRVNELRKALNSKI
jgi:phenylacetate-CoA ligase